uniref:Bcl-2 Bcl-2 homology region 1-3 domain-containing protein n=1 Tax=Sinocyclocheilus anshuiensis TaxID=1608454 RepID=A0A671LEH7_9TELE
MGLFQPQPVRNNSKGTNEVIPGKRLVGSPYKALRGGVMEHAMTRGLYKSVQRRSYFRFALQTRVSTNTSTISFTDYALTFNSILSFFFLHISLSFRHHALPTMKRVVADVLLKCLGFSAGMLQHLQLDSQPDDLSFIGCIAKTMFRDDTTNWGRIVSLVAFGAVVCSQMKELQRERCVETVAQQISSYLISEQHDWLLNNKGWVSDTRGKSHSYWIRPVFHSFQLHFMAV